MSCLQKTFLVVLACQLGTASYPSAYAQDHSESKKFYVGMEMGVGWLELSRNNVPADRDSRFVMAFYGGYSPFRWLRLGLNLSGWLIEPGNLNDPSEGISIGNTYGQIEFFPIKKLNHLFLNLEGGISNYSNHHRDGYNARGTGTKFGLGFEYDTAKHLGLSLTVNYCTGHFDDVLYPLQTINQHYNAVEVLLGITYH